MSTKTKKIVWRQHTEIQTNQLFINQRNETMSIPADFFKELIMFEYLNEEDKKFVEEQGDDILTIVCHTVPPEKRDSRGAFSDIWWSIEDGSGEIYKTNFNTSSGFAMELSNFEWDEEEEEPEEEPEEEEEPVDQEALQKALEALEEEDETDDPFGIEN